MNPLAFALSIALFAMLLMGAEPPSPPPDVLGNPLVQMFLCVVLGGLVKDFVASALNGIAAAVRKRAKATPSTDDDIAAEAFASSLEAMSLRIRSLPTDVVAAALKRGRK